jgi:hypothetical protein
MFYGFTMSIITMIPAIYGIVSASINHQLALLIMPICGFILSILWIYFGCSSLPLPV